MFSSKIADLAAAQSTKALEGIAATSAALRTHEAECAQARVEAARIMETARIEAERRADQRDERNRAEAEAWREGLGKRLDKQDQTLSRLMAILISIAGTAFTMLLGAFVWLLLHSPEILK